MLEVKILFIHFYFFKGLEQEELESDGQIICKNTHRKISRMSSGVFLLVCSHGIIRGKISKVVVSHVL